MARLDRRLVALALTCGLLAALALPAAAAPPAATGSTNAGPSALPPAGPRGLVSILADWLHELFGERDPSPPERVGDVLGKRTGPAGPLIDPNGAKLPQDPQPLGDHGPRR